MEYYIVLKKSANNVHTFRSPEAFSGLPWEEWHFGESRFFRLVKVITEANLTLFLKADRGVAYFHVYNSDFPKIFNEHIHLCPKCGGWFVHLAEDQVDRDDCILAEEILCEDCNPNANKTTIH